MRKIQILTLLLTLLLFAGCSQDTNDTNRTTLGGLEKDLVLDVDFTVVEGDFGTGSMYELYCPDSWNGNLVVYTHGYVFPDQEPALPQIAGLRDAWLEMGYGVAYSSYSQTGWAVDVAMNESRQLRGLFSSSFGHPDKTYLTGNSMGGNIALALAERNHNLYDGVVITNGVVGGAKMAVDYIFNIRALFDYYYPGVLPGSVVYVPEGLEPEAAQGLAYAALLANPGPAFEMAGITPVNIQYANGGELFAAILTGIYFHVSGHNDFLENTHGHNFFDNSDIWYSGSNDDETLNATIARHSSTPDAEAFFRHWYEPTGVLKIPAVTLHSTRDQVVQIFHEDRYFEKVNAAGYGDNLVQYYIDRFGHTSITVDEFITGFTEMVEMGNSQNRRRNH